MSQKGRENTRSNCKSIREFSRFANEYNSYNQIQSMVAKELVSMIGKRVGSGKIVDIGCGTGLVYDNCIEQGLVFDTFVATDGSSEMLKLHKSDHCCTKQLFDFNNERDLSEFSTQKYDLILSSSALQWSSDLDTTLKYISKSSQQIIASLFTNKTFQTIHKFTGADSPLRCVDEFRDIFDIYYDASYSICSYKLYFESKDSIFKYIKHSGVSGGNRQISFKQTKNLINNYPYDYLEFEVLFVNGISRNY